MKEFEYCHEEITMGVEIFVTVCETQKEMVKIISEYRKECKWGTADEYTVIWVIYKDGSTFYHAFNDGEVEGKFKRTGIERAVISTSWELIVFGDFSIIDNGSISIDESDIEEYGVYAGQYDVKEQTEETAPEAAETVESVEETTAPETETVETEVAEKFIIYVSDDDLNVFCAKVFIGTVKELDDECDRIIAETNCEEYLHVLCYTDKRWEWVQKHYNQVSKSALSVVVRKTETAEQETELNAEVAEVETEQTAEPETFSKSESESEPTAENITVSGTNQGNINVLIVADIANTFEMITHTGYFDTS